MAIRHNGKNDRWWKGGTLRSCLRNTLPFGRHWSDQHGSDQDDRAETQAPPIQPQDVQHQDVQHQDIRHQDIQHQDMTTGIATSAEDRPRSERGDPATSQQGAVLLPFPIHGEALLVRLAELLRQHVGHRSPLREPFLFALSRQPRSRLTIDRQSHVEFVADRAEFRLEITAELNTTITITTVDFDALVAFVVHYLSAQLADAPSLEAAS